VWNAIVSFLGQIARVRFGLLLQARRSPAGFCHPMHLSDFIDFISVEREREDRVVVGVVNTCSRRRIPLSQLEDSDRGAIDVGGRNRINLRIRKLISVNISKTVQDRDILSMED